MQCSSFRLLHLRGWTSWRTSSTSRETNWQLQLNHRQNVNNMLMVQVVQQHRRVQRRRRQRRVQLASSPVSWKSCDWKISVHSEWIPICSRNAITAEFAEEVIEAPITKPQWIRIADQFSRRWQFQHCWVPIAICCPRNGGSDDYNYKGFHSIILML